MGKDVFILSKKEYKKYSVEYREYVAKMVIQDGHKIKDISMKLNIPYGTLRRWVGNYRKKEQEAVKEGQRQLFTATEYKELYEKERKEKLDLEEENEILKKAMHIFTQEEK